MQCSPLFLFGVAHSGTTILYRMLAYHPDLTWFSQFSLRGGEVRGRRRVPAANRLDHLLRSIPHRWGKRKTRGRGVLVPRPGEARTIWESLLANEPDAERLCLTLTRFSRRHGGRMILAKWPEFDRHLDLLSAAFPHARFVHIVRDGRPISLSLRPKFERTLDPDDALRAAAQHWVDVVGRADAARELDLLEVKYEDLCADVHGAIRRVLDHAGLPDTTFPFDRCPTVLSNRNDWHLAAASTREIEEITRVQESVLSGRGY
jgi:hypothetical protein